MTSILFCFLEPLITNYIYIYIYVYHTSPHKLLALRTACLSNREHSAKTHCKEEMLRQTTQLERKQNCILICTNIYSLLILIFSIALPHIFLVFFFSTGKRIYKGHCCSFCPTNMYNTYTLYIYIYLYMLTSQKGGQLVQTNRSGGHKHITMTLPTTHPQRSVVIKKNCNYLSAAETVYP